MPLYNHKKPRREGRTITVGKPTDVPEGQGATVELKNGTELALFHIGGQFYAIENFCPHRGAPLVDGALCGTFVECGWHGWRFDVRSGQCATNRTAVESYEVVIDDDKLKIIV